MLCWPFAAVLIVAAAVVSEADSAAFAAAIPVADDTESAAAAIPRDEVRVLSAVPGSGRASAPDHKWVAGEILPMDAPMVVHSHNMSLYFRPKPE